MIEDDRGRVEKFVVERRMAVKVERDQLVDLIANEHVAVEQNVLFRVPKVDERGEKVQVVLEERMREIERGVEAAEPKGAVLVGDERVLVETSGVRRKRVDDRRTRVDRPGGKVRPERLTGEDRSIERIETRKGEIEQQVVIESEVRVGDFEANQSIGEDQRVSIEINH